MNRIRTIILFLNHWLCIAMPSDIRFRGIHGFVSIIVELFLAVLNTLLQWNACYNEKIRTLCIVKGRDVYVSMKTSYIHRSSPFPFFFYFLVAINILLTSLHFCENIYSVQSKSFNVHHFEYMEKFYFFFRKINFELNWIIIQHFDQVNRFFYLGKISIYRSTSIFSKISFRMKKFYFTPHLFSQNSFLPIIFCKFHFRNYRNLQLYSDIFQTWFIWNFL